LKSRIIVLCLVFLISCKTYYSASKVYYDNDNALIHNSIALNIKEPLRINFSGNVTDSIKDYKVNGFIKIESSEHYQIFLFSRTYGIEICRIDINKKNIAFIDKLNKKFYVGELANFKYLLNSKILGEHYLQLLLGRIFADVNLIKMKELRKFSYDKSGIRGEFELFDFGFAKQHKIMTDNFLFDLSFDKYLVKYDIPSILKGTIKLREVDLKIDILFNVGDSSKLSFDELIVPNGYTQVL